MASRTWLGHFVLRSASISSGTSIFASTLVILHHCLCYTLLPGYLRNNKEASTTCHNVPVTQSHHQTCSRKNNVMSSVLQPSQPGSVHFLSNSAPFACSYYFTMVEASYGSCSEKEHPAKYKVSCRVAPKRSGHQYRDDGASRKRSLYRGPQSRRDSSGAGTV